MARRALLTPIERAGLMGIPEAPEAIVALCAIDEADMSLIRQRRGDPNILGFAVQLCLLRRPGVTVGADTIVPAAIIEQLALNLGVSAASWAVYAVREETRQAHAREVRAYLGTVRSTV